MSQNLKVAYFTMEIGLNSLMPTYAGGLGMLSADIMRSCADKELGAACITIAWKHGYMKQKINSDGSQIYSDTDWQPEEFLEKLDQVITVKIEDREVKVGAWKYDLVGINGNKIPIIFLDTDHPENSPQDKEITNYLYGGDQNMRIKQEVVLGIGGIRMLRALDYQEVSNYHMNEGHAAFLTLELLKERDYQDKEVQKSCAFTTHTPVKAGHDVFEYESAWRIVGNMLPWHIKALAGEENLSMTKLAMSLSHYICGVSQIHGEVSRKMFPESKIDHITNGIHHLTWAHPEMETLFDQYCSGWKENPSLLEKHCREIPDEDLWNTHQSAKQELIDYVNSHNGLNFDAQHLTIASARRVVPYKRPELIYQNLERLKEIACGRVQIIHAGNAHPSDPFSQGVIQRMVERSKKLKDCVKIAYLENYNPELAKKLVRGADVWLNTPMRLHEASGTSGMKACLNGVLNVSTLDGWWIEAFKRDSEAGWRIGPLARAIDEESHRKIDAEDVYTLLEFEVIPEFIYKDKVRWARRMKRSIGLIGYFNTHRCVDEYLEKAWIN